MMSCSCSITVNQIMAQSGLRHGSPPVGNPVAPATGFASLPNLPVKNIRFRMVEGPVAVSLQSGFGPFQLQGFIQVVGEQFNGFSGIVFGLGADNGSAAFAVDEVNGMVQAIDMDEGGYKTGIAAGAMWCHVGFLGFERCHYT